MGLTCINSIPGIGETCQQVSPFSVTSGLFFTAPDFKFASYQDFVTESKWAEYIAAGKIFPVQNVLDEEVQDFEDAIQETSTGSKIYLFEGKRGRMYKVMLPLDMHKKLRSYSFKNWRLITSDISNNIIATSDDATTVKGRRLSFCRVTKLGTPSADSGSTTGIQVQWANIEEMDTSGIYANPTWLASDIQGILSVDLTAGAVGTNTFTATVAYVDGSEITNAGAKKSTPVSGLVTANFQILNGTTPVTVTATETAVLGTYTISGTTIVAGYTAKVIPSTDNLYQSERETLA